ncbi:kelch repeat and BTB domain-containing protein 2, partial [Agrilus planipennis]|uniref:Kelch repeat and BTB domain-containing protein 2 n=1 Tax=Agrilus planipennis TaxID=224129 RepID=A0A7F5R1Z0_AGRPL
MGDSKSTSEEIVLIAENVSFVCNKKELAKHSDYFKVMFEGNFVEKNQRLITLQEVDSRSLKIILTLLWDSSFVINEEDILLVLEAACMLQFPNIKEICVTRIREILAPSNCIKVWFGTEKLDIEDLHLKAKYLSLVEFNEIKDMDCLIELHLKQLHLYLSDVNLQCRCEFDVFFVCMKWWYENCLHSEKLLYENKTKNLLYLVSSLNYRALSDSDLREMLSYPDISENQDVKDLFMYFIALKNQEERYLLSELRNIVAHLLNSVDRFQQKVPCFLAQNASDDLPNKKLKVMSPDKELAVIYHDQFKRKRYYKILNKESTSHVIVYFDINSNKFKKLLDVDKGKCDKLDGFKMLSYKEFIFLFGGEYKIGRGDWNRSFWVYDNVKEKWQHKSVIPQVRRHFESCLVGEFLYIIGGAGNYRIIQENMLWYNYKTDLWSKVIMLPCPGRQIKCCAFKKNKLFLLNVNNKCGLLFNND